MQKELCLIDSCDLPDSYASITTGLNTEDSNTADPWQGPEICILASSPGGLMQVGKEQCFEKHGANRSQSTGFPDLLEATDG